MKLLFLCTGNSCRSQMAEGWAHHLLADLMPEPDLEIASAGLEAHGLNPLAVEVMAEFGVDISGQSSSVLTAEILNNTDLIITLCGHADETCPVLPPDTLKRHMPFDDPAAATGDYEEIIEVFRRVCLEIKRELELLLPELLATQATHITQHRS